MKRLRRLRRRVTKEDGLTVTLSESTLCDLEAGDVMNANGLIELQNWHRAERFRERYGRWTAFRAAVDHVVSPLVGLVRLLVQMGESSSEVAAREGISRIVQARTLIPIVLRRAPPKEAYLHRLYVPARAGSADRYVWQYSNMALLRWINPDHGRIWSKLEFHRDCRNHRLPTVPVIAAITDQRLVAVDRPEHTDSVVWNDVIVKPDLGLLGRGTFRWTQGFEALLRHLSSRPQQDGVEQQWVVQAPIAPHPALLPIAGRALGTLRLTTYRTPEGGIAVALPTLKITVGAGVVDHIQYGNLAAPVDENGRLGMARGYSAGHVVREYSRHPETGASIIGREVPLWAEAISLVQRAHACFPRLFAVGWDVALTPNGALLLEGNRVFGVEMIQIAWDTPLGDTAYVDALAHELARVGARPRQSAAQSD